MRQSRLVSDLCLLISDTNLLDRDATFFTRLFSFKLKELCLAKFEFARFINSVVLFVHFLPLAVPKEGSATITLIHPPRVNTFPVKMSISHSLVVERSRLAK